jgi:hypothetical protein
MQHVYMMHMLSRSLLLHPCYTGAMLKIFNRSIACVAASIFVLAGCAHKAPVAVRSNTASTSEGGAVIVAAGSAFYGRLSPAIGTKISKDGDTFTLTQTDTFMHKNPQLAGSVVTGHLEDVHPAGLGRKPAMTIVFDGIKMSDGSTHPIGAQLVSMSKFEPKTHHLRTIGMMIGGAVGGHIAAQHMGKKHGALMGAAGAYLLSQEIKTDIYVPAGSLVQLRLTSPVTQGEAPAQE